MGFISALARKEGRALLGDGAITPRIKGGQRSDLRRALMSSASRGLTVLSRKDWPRLGFGCRGTKLVVVGPTAVVGDDPLPVAGVACGGASGGVADGGT